MSTDAHTRLVLVLRVALPLIALGILSTLFMFSERIEPGENIPFAQADVQERVRNQRISQPLFKGVTQSGDELSFTAEQIVTTREGNRAENLSARLQFREGGSMVVIADEGELVLARDHAELSGNVLVQSTTGYRLNSERVTARMSSVDLVFPGEVWGNGPAGTLNAQALRISEGENGGGIVMLFTGGVKLVYDPKE